jgi:hypothetical protein
MAGFERISCLALRGFVQQTLLAPIFVFGIATTVFAQSSSLTALAQDAERMAHAERRVVVSDGVFRIELPVASAPYTDDWPRATVPARSLKAGIDPTVPEFRIRSWREGGAGVRVVVFAVTVSGPTRDIREDQITSVFVPIDQFVEIAATEKYNARPISLTAYVDAPRPRRPYLIETPKIDIPVRPWTPPQRPR